MYKYFKILLYFLLLIVTTKSFCQETIRIDYQLQIADEPGLFVDVPYIREDFLKVVNSKIKPTFSLVLQRGNSYFFENSELTDVQTNGMMNAFGNFTGEIYTKNDSVYTKQNLLGNKIFKKSKYKENWLLTSETKIIDTFLCYKATNVNVVIGLKDKIWNHPVIAWYCPKLPYQLGPNGYGNLPGLILALQVRNAFYIMSKIDFNSNEKFNINILKKATMKSESEINLIYDNNHKKDGEIIKKNAK
jgi:GLPGLI family protein